MITFIKALTAVLPTNSISFRLAKLKSFFTKGADLKAMWAEKQNPTAEEIAKIDTMLINAGLKEPPQKAGE
jgi:hypothetical protein